MKGDNVKQKAYKDAARCVLLFDHNNIKFFTIGHHQAVFPKKPPFTNIPINTNGSHIITLPVVGNYHNIGRQGIVVAYGCIIACCVSPGTGCCSYYKSCFVTGAARYFYKPVINFKSSFTCTVLRDNPRTCIALTISQHTIIAIASNTG